jgi:hypothetical protein
MGTPDGCRRLYGTILKVKVAAALRPMIHDVARLEGYQAAAAKVFAMREFSAEAAQTAAAAYFEQKWALIAEKIAKKQQALIERQMEEIRRRARLRAERLVFLEQQKLEKQDRREARRKFFEARKSERREKTSRAKLKAVWAEELESAAATLREELLSRRRIRQGGTD